MADELGHCFLCAPQNELIYKESSNFFAMTGLGPIVDGYSILAYKHHSAGMLDIAHEHRHEYNIFLTEVCTLLSSVFTSPLITEHGRMPLCQGDTPSESSSHCYHAHQLLFPTQIDLSSDFLAYYPSAKTFHSMAEVFTCPTDSEYFLVIRLGSPGYIVPIYGNHYSQFFRRLVANCIGKPNLYDWRVYSDLSRALQSAEVLREAANL